MFRAHKWVDRSMEIIRHLRGVADEKQVDDLFVQFTSKPEKPLVVSWLNANVLNVAQKNTELTESLLQSDILLRDGVGVSILLKMLKRPSGLNMNGTDCIPKILRLYAGKSVALLGTRDPYLSKAKEAVEKMGCNVVLCMDGFRAPEDYLRSLSEHEVEVVVLGMGVPKQERLSIMLSERLTQPMLILNGGAILDFLAGRFPRAPKIWRIFGMEWLFRLILEPKRLWRRYIIGIPVFVFNMASLIYALKSRQVHATMPLQGAEPILSGVMAEQEE